MAAVTVLTTARVSGVVHAAHTNRRSLGGRYMCMHMCMCSLFQRSTRNVAASFP